MAAASTTTDVLIIPCDGTADSGSLAASLLPTPKPILNDDDHYEFFWETSSIYSQWIKSDFVIDGVTYCMAEQWMMAGKARLMDDHVTLAKIMNTRDARKIKNLGWEVTPFDDAKWIAHREEILYQGNLAKFTQNSKFAEELLTTGDKVIVEAAPNDRAYGIGMTAQQARITPVAQWAGENILGQQLMRVRQTLRAAAAAAVASA